jgi:uncharacterized membrane protein YfcA
MEMFLLLAGAGFLAGAMNAVAGGGSFIAFPALVLAGLPSVPANASTTVALFPGTVASVLAYRNDPKGFEEVSLRGLLITSICGGLLGALALLATPSPTFDFIVPWLLLVATFTFTFGQKLGVWLRQWVRIGARELLCVQFVLGIYSGYFGGGVGIMMLAAWSLLISADIMRLNPTRIMVVCAANGVAVLCFLFSGKIWWPQTLCMLVGSVLGGYAGASIARRANPKVLRTAIIVIGFGMTAVFFYRASRG